MKNFDQLVKLLVVHWTLDCHFVPRSATLSSLARYGDKAPPNPFSLFLSPRRAAALAGPSYPQSQMPVARFYPQFAVDNLVLFNLPVDILWISMR